MNTSKLAIVEDNLFITDEEGVDQPAWKHEDGTLVSHWDGLKELLIQDEDGVRKISHVDAIEYGYELIK